MFCCVVKLSCVVASPSARSSKPISRCFGDITRPRNVRWSRNATTDSGSVTRASAPNACLNNDSAIGVTYSCEKRTSATANNASPGLTASTPIFPAVTNACFAMIFSTIVIGRAGVSTGGGETLPASRALFGVRRGLARRATTLRKTGNNDRELAVFDLVFLDGAFAHTDVDVLTKRFVVVEANPARRDLVRGNVA